MKDDLPWLRQSTGARFTRDPAFGRLLGWDLIAVTIGSGLLAALVVIAVPGAGVLTSQWWILAPAAVPLAFSIVRGRSVFLGILCGLCSATIAFLIVGVYLLWQVACFILTFMGDC